MRFILDQAGLTYLDTLLSKDHKFIFFLDVLNTSPQGKFELSFEEVRMIEFLSLLVKEKGLKSKKFLAIKE